VAPLQRDHLRQPVAANWQCTMPTLSQQLGSFPIESRAGICSLVKTRLPSSTPINRSWFHVPREKKIELKVGKKPAFPTPFSCNLSLLYLLSSSWLSATTIFITCLLSIIPTFSSHQTISRGGCTISLSLSSPPSLPPL
jgi:hypothetical protein